MSVVPTSVSEREQRFQDVVAAYLDACEVRGSGDLSALLARHPDLADEITAFVASQDELARLAAPLRDIVAGLTPAPEDTLPRGTAAAPLRAGRIFGDYELLEEIGRGGMGVVYRARQKVPARLVAVKVIRRGDREAEVAVARFRNEAEAVGLLDHPNVVPIYEVGDHEGVLHFSMKLVEGGSLAEALPRFARDPRAAVALMADVARAVHHAHQRGVLHRDIKPSNILLDREGRPHVTDFGLAKRLTAGQSLTQTGELVGTPTYMAPEQARGEAVTISADVYGLGAVLYALLTGRPPFRGDTALATLAQVADAEPESPSSLNRLVDRDLATVCLKCLEKQPARRYPSAEALAQDLGRWLAGEPVEARPAGPLRRGLRWCRRNPQTAAFIPVVALVAAGGAAAMILWLVMTARAREAAQAEAALLRRKLYPARMRLAHQHFLHGEVNLLRTVLDEFRPGPGEEDLRGFEWYYLRGLANAIPHERLCYRGHTGELMCAIFTPDGREVVSGDEDGAIHCWDAATGTRRLVLADHRSDVNGLDFSRGDGTLASAGEDRKVRLWDAVSGRLKVELFVDCGEIEGISFSPDGRRLVAPDSHGRVILLDLTGGGLRIRALWGAHAERVYTAVFSPDGRRVATCSQDGHLKVWDADDGRLLSDTHHGHTLFDVAFSPDGARLVTADGRNAIRLWEAQGGRALGIVGHHLSPARAVAFSPDGGRVASVADDNVLRIWYPAERFQLARAGSHLTTTTAVSFSPDGKAVVTASRDKTVRVWDVATPLPWQTPAAARGPNAQAAFSPDGRFLAVWAPGSELVLWTCSPLKKVATLPFGPRTGHLVAFAPDGKHLAVSSEDGPLRIYRLVADGESLRLAQVATHPVSLEEFENLTFDTDRTMIISKIGTIWFSWPIDGAGTHPKSAGWRLSQTCRVVASPDGRTLAVGGGWEVRFRDRVEPTGQEGKCNLPAPLRCLAYAPDGQLLAAGTADGRVALIDTGSQEIRAYLYADQQAVTSVAWSPDGRTLVSSSLSGKVRLWHAATQQELFTLEDREGRAVRSVVFSPDGRVLMTAGDPVPEGRNVTLWYGVADGLP